jgi:hypothetical protein
MTENWNYNVNSNRKLSQTKSLVVIAIYLLDNKPVTNRLSGSAPTPPTACQLTFVFRRSFQAAQIAGIIFQIQFVSQVATV